MEPERGPDRFLWGVVVVVVVLAVVWLVLHLLNVYQ
jgi:ABC-type transporter Mla subunit MlaD